MKWMTLAGFGLSLFALTGCDTIQTETPFGQALDVKHEDFDKIPSFNGDWAGVGKGFPQATLALDSAGVGKMRLKIKPHEDSREYDAKFMKLPFEFRESVNEFGIPPLLLFFKPKSPRSPDENHWFFTWVTIPLNGASDEKKQADYLIITSPVRADEWRKYKFGNRSAERSHSENLTLTGTPEDIIATLGRNDPRKFMAAGTSLIMERVTHPDAEATPKDKKQPVK